MLTAPFLFAAVVLQAPQVPAKPTPDKVLARVNGAPITAADVEPYLWDWRASEVAEDLILLKTAEQAAQKANIVLTDAEVDDRVKVEMAQLQAGNYDAQKLREQGFPMSRIVLKVRTALLLERLTLASLKPEEWAQVGTIEFKPPTVAPITWGKASQEASEVYAKLQKGALWEKVRTADSQPDHWAPIASLPPEIATKVKSASGGAVLPPRQSGNAIQIVRVIAWGGHASPVQIKDLQAFYVQQNRNATLAKLRDGAKIERTP